MRWLRTGPGTAPPVPGNNGIGNTGNFHPRQTFYPRLATIPGGFMPNISQALTYLNLQGNTEDGSHHYLHLVQGTAFTDKNFVVVRWAWLTLPFTINVLGLIFLIVTAISSKRHQVPLWKSSAFAFLYHGLEEESLDDTRLYKKASDMEKAAGKTLVTLGPSDTGGKRLRLRS